MSVSTHVLDTTRGRPAAGIEVRLSRRLSDHEWKRMGQGQTDAEGRIRDLTDEPLGAGEYRLEFITQSYFDAAGMDSFYPDVTVAFKVSAEPDHVHVPLLLSPFGYTTYRGS